MVAPEGNYCALRPPAKAKIFIVSHNSREIYSPRLK